MTKEERTRIEQALVRHYNSNCQECDPRQRTKGSVPMERRWYTLCELHGALVRSVLEPGYLDWLRSIIKRNQAEAATYEKLYTPLIERFTKGRAWLDKNKDHPKREEALSRRDAIKSQLPPELASGTFYALEQALRIRKEELAMLEEKADFIVAHACELDEILKGGV
jgi:hypothetical protein